MLKDAFHDCDDGFQIRYRFDGKLFNPLYTYIGFHISTVTHALSSEERSTAFHKLILDKPRSQSE